MSKKKAAGKPTQARVRLHGLVTTSYAGAEDDALNEQPLGDVRRHKTTANLLLLHEDDSDEEMEGEPFNDYGEELVSDPEAAWVQWWSFDMSAVDADTLYDAMDSMSTDAAHLASAFNEYLRRRVRKRYMVALLDNMEVQPRYRRHNIGSLLIQSITREMDGVAGIMVANRISTEQLRAFYQSISAVEVARTDEYFKESVLFCIPCDSGRKQLYER